VKTSDLKNTVYTRHCQFSQLSEIQWELEQLLKPWIEDDNHLNFVTLAIIEGLANIFEHNLGQENNENNEVILTVSRDYSSSLVQLIDNGKAPPAQVRNQLIGKTSKMPRIDTDELPESGWGLNFMQFATTGIDYQRLNGKNILELMFEDSPVNTARQTHKFCE